MVKDLMEDTIAVTGVKVVIMPKHIHGILTLTPTETPEPRRGAALVNHRSHPTDTVCPNATPGSDSIKSQPETVSLGLEQPWIGTSGSDQRSIALPLESEPGVTFGQGMGEDGGDGLPNVAPLRGLGDRFKHFLGQTASNPATLLNCLALVGLLCTHNQRCSL